MRKVLLFIIFLSIHLAAYAQSDTIRYVKPRDKGGAYTNDGLTWATAKDNIQDAINDMRTYMQQHGLHSGSVYVASGSYEPTEGVEGGTNGQLSTSFIIYQGIHVYGGFNVNNPEAKPEDRELYYTVNGKREYKKMSDVQAGDTTIVGFRMAHTTYLDGNHNHNAETAVRWNSNRKRYDTSFPGNSYHVVFFASRGFISNASNPGYADSLQYNTSVDGFTIQNGNAVGVTDVRQGGRDHTAFGGGVYMVKNSVVRNCIIQKCSAAMRGGGVYMDGGGELISSDVSRCQTLGAGVSGGLGGGVCIDNAGSVRGSWITGNVARLGGGIALMSYPENHPRGSQAAYRRGDFDPFVSAVIVSNNTATTEGGGIYLDRGGIVNHATIVRNDNTGRDISYGRTRYGRTGGLFIYGAGQVYNSIIWGNTCAANNDIQYAASTSDVTIPQYITLRQPLLSYTAMNNLDITNFTGTVRSNVYSFESVNNDPQRSGNFPLFISPTAGSGCGQGHVSITSWFPSSKTSLQNKAVRLDASYMPTSNFSVTSMASIDFFNRPFSPISTLGAVETGMEDITTAMIAPVDSADCGGSTEAIPTLFVDPNRIIVDPSAQAGASWTEPLDNIAEAIEYFNEHKPSGNFQILVKQGTTTSAGIGAFYELNGNGQTAVSQAAIRLLPYLKMYGGFPSSNTGTDTKNRNPKNYPTRISGDIISSNYRNNALHVVSFSRAHDAVLDGFQIYYGNARGASSAGSADGGGAILVDNFFFPQATRVSMTNNVVRNCVLANCSGPTGGAVLVNGGYPDAQGDTVKSSLTLENVIINNCAAPANIIQVSGPSSVKMDHCTVVGNVVNRGGSLLATTRNYGVDGTIDVTNSAFHGNVIGNSQNKPASVNDVTPDVLLPLTSGNNITANNNITDKGYTTATQGFSRTFGFDSNDTLSYPGFANPVRNLGVAQNTADNTVYGGPADYTPLDMNPVVNRATASGSHSSWGTDLTATVTRDYGGAPDVGALECHQDSVNTNGGQATYGSVIYVRDYNTYNANGSVATQDNSTVDRDGTSWTRAINGNAIYNAGDTTLIGLQYAVNQASASTETSKPEVWVAEGIYTNKSTNTINDQNYAFAMREGVNVFGGFPKNGNPSMNERDPKSFVTILQPQNEDPTDTASVLIHNSAASVARVLVQPGDFKTETSWNGFTIRYGYLQSVYQRDIKGNINNITPANIGTSGGAGAYLMENGVLENCELVHNTILVDPEQRATGRLRVINGNDSPTNHGGGFHQAGAGVYITTTNRKTGVGGTLKNCVVAYNDLLHKLTLINNDGETHKFTESVWMYGAGVYQDRGIIYNTIIHDNSMLVVYGNTSTAGNQVNEVLVGAGAFLVSGQFYNNTIVNNTARTYGSGSNNIHIRIPGVYVYTDITMYNSIVSDNTSSGTANSGNKTVFDVPVCAFTLTGDNANARYTLDASKVKVHYSFINITKDHANNLCDTGDGDNTNIYLDYNKSAKLTQQYTTDKIYDRSSYRLISGSPCINAGTDAIDGVTIPSYDASYADRVQDCTIDIGAYEYNGSQDITPRVTTEIVNPVNNNGTRVRKEVSLAEYFVNQNGNGNSSADSPANAACENKLQRVLDAAGRYKYAHPKAHVVIRLEALPDSAGYTPTRSTVTTAGEVNPRSYSFIVPMGVEIDGGWRTNGDFGIDSNGKLHGKDPINNITRLSGEYVSGTQTVNVYHVVTFTDRVFDENGKPTDKLLSDSIQLYMPNSSTQSNYDVTDHTFDRAKLHGLYIEGGRAEGINEEDQNGAAAILPNYAIVSNCIVRDNHANGNGGAFYMLPGAVIEGSIIENNEAANGGAVAVAVEDSSSNEEIPWAFLLSNTITRNTATSRGGGLYFTNNARTWNSVYWNNTGAEQNDISGVTDTENEQNIINTPVNFCAITNQNIAGNNNINLSPTDADGTRWGTDVNLKQKHDYDYYLPSRASVLTRAGMPYDVLYSMIAMMPGIDSTDIAGVSRIQFTRADSLVCDTAYDGEKLVLKDNYAVEIGARALNDNFSITIDPQHPLYRLFVAHPEYMNANTAQALMDSKDAVYRQQGSSFANPFLRLTDALNYVVDARKNHPGISRNKRFEIFLAEGTYAPFADMYGRQQNVRSHTFVVPEMVSIYGGIDARNPKNQYCQNTSDGQTITVDTVTLIGASTDSIRLKRERFDLNQNSIVEPWEMSHATVLTGLTEGSDFMVHNVYHVITSIADQGVVGSQPDMTDAQGNVTTDRDKETFASRGNRAIILDGLTVSDGAAMNYESSVYNPDLYFRGGGVCVSGDNMQNEKGLSDMKTGDRNIVLVISNSLFQNNTARLGGAIFSDGPVHVVGSSFVQNLTESPEASDTADIKYVTFSGGGAIATNNNLFAVNTIFANNEARDGGASITIDNDGTTKRKNISNTAEVDSAGNQVPVTKNANQMRGYGGVIWAGDHSAVRLINCNSVRNKAHAYASIYNCTPNTAESGPGHPHFGVNCIFWGNRVDAGQDSLLMNYGATKIGGLYFSAYQQGKGLPATVTPNVPDSVFQKQIIQGGYNDIFQLDSILGNANHNIILSDDNNAIDGPNFTLPSNEAGVDGYLPSADWVPSRINRLCDAGWGSIRQTTDGQFLKEPNIDLSGRETWFINGVYGLLADFYMREFHITLMPQGDEKYMMYANDDGTEGDRNMNRISSDPLGTVTRDYIDIGVYEYQHTLLHIADGDEVDELWVSDDETTGNNDGRDIDHPTSDLQRAIQTLLQSRNDHPKVVHIMEGTYSPIYELDGNNYGFQIHNTASPSSVALPKTIVSGHGYQATSITLLGGYSKTIKGQRDVEQYPTVFRMVNRANSTDANVAHLFYIGDAEQWKTSGTLSGGGSSSGSTIDLSRNAIDKTSFTNGQAMPVVFDGITFVNPYASDNHKDIDDNGSAVASPYTSGTASGGAAIYYREQFKSAQETVTQSDNGTPDKSTTRLDPLSSAPKLTIRNCKFEDNADSTSHNVPAVFIGKGGGRTVIYNTLFDDNHGAPIISYDSIDIVNCTFARNGGHVTVKTDEAQQKSSLSNSILWETLNETAANTNGQYEGFLEDSVRHNAIYRIGTTGEKNGNVNLSATNSDPMNGPNFLNVTSALGQTRDFSLNPGMQTMDRADSTLYNRYTAVYKVGVTIPDGDSSLVVLRPDTTMTFDLSWGARFFGNGLDVGAYECRVKQQRVLYVRPSQPTNTTGTEIGSSWENYYGNRQLQTAIDAAAIFASTNKKRAYVLVKGEANNSAVQDAISLRDNVSIYGSIPENFLQSIPEDAEDDDNAVNTYLSNMIASRPGVAARSARRSRIAGIRTDDDDYSNGALIDGFEVRSNADPQVPTVYVTKPVVLSKIIVDGNATTNGQPVVDMQEGLMYNSLVFGNVPRQSNANSVPMMRLGKDAAVLNSTIVSDSIGVKALGGEGYLANSITYGYTDKTLTAMKGEISRDNTLVCDSVNTQSGIPFAPYLTEDVNPISLSSYITDFAPYRYQLHESSEDITGGNDDLDNIIANAPGDATSGAKFILTQAKNEGWVNFQTNHDILGNRRFFGSHIDRGCYETWYVKADTTEVATADNYPHEGSVVYIMKNANLNLGQRGDDPIYTTVNPFKPAFLLMSDGASLYGNGNTILVPYMAVEKSFSKDVTQALVSLPFRYRVGDAIQTFFDPSIGQINARRYTNFEAFRYDGEKRSAWDYHFDADNSDCWTPVDKNEILEPNTGWLATFPDHDDETVRLVAAAETDGDYVYTEYGTSKTVSLTQHDTSSSGSGAHFTKAENMGWNIMGLPFLVSNYKTGVTSNDDTDYPMNVPHVVYTMDSNGKFLTAQSWDVASALSFGMGVMTQTAIIPNATNNGVETVTFALPHQDVDGQSQSSAKAMIALRSDDGETEDELQVNASETAKSLQYTLGNDGVKWLPLNKNLSSIYALTDGGTPLSLSAETPVETNIPVVVRGPLSGESSIAIVDTDAFNTVSHVWLRDDSTGFVVDLKNEPLSLGTSTGIAGGNSTATGIRHLTLRLGDTRPDGSRDNSSSAIDIYLTGRTLHVDGLKAGDDVVIYTISGQLFMRGKSADGSFTTDLSRGVYVVKAGGKGKAVGVK